MRLAACISVVILLLGTGSTWAVEDEPTIEAARQHYARGLELVEKGEYIMALQEFTAAYDTSPYFAVLYNIAQTEIALDRHLEAATTLARYLREGGENVPPNRVDRVKEQIARLEAFFGVLTVSTEPPGATISVDGRTVGQTPLDEPIRLAPGAYTIVATLDDGRSFEKSVAIRQGTEHVVTLQLPPVPPAPPPVPPTLPPPPPPPHPVSGPSRLGKAMPHVLVGTGVALVVGALGTYVWWERKAYERWQDAQPVLGTLEPGSPSYGSAAAESNRRADSVTAAKITVFSLAAVGGAAIATGSVLYVLGRRSQTQSAMPTVSWNGGTSLTLGWRTSW
jgi:hypothetical protein